MKNETKSALVILKLKGAWNFGDPLHNRLWQIAVDLASRNKDAVSFLEAFEDKIDKALARAKSVRQLHRLIDCTSEFQTKFREAAGLPLEGHNLP